jgi:ketosteroid isomerase-like protein
MMLMLAAWFAATATVATGDVQAVVDKWLAAQNAGDLAAYDKLFAARFTGVRRSGPRTVRFDRTGWMRDRGRMFKKPMTVGISDVKVRAGGATALVSFKQTFAQGNYKDEGPKELVIVREAGLLKITSEKMLRSEIFGAPLPADERFRFVVSNALLLSASPDEDWATGPFTYRDDDGIDADYAARGVDMRKLPAEFARWQGRPVRLVTTKGAACLTKVTGFRLMSRFEAHPSQTEEWKAMKPADAGREAWELGTKALVADVEKKCEDAFWGQPAAQAAAEIDAGATPDAALKARALAEARKTSAWKEIQEAYRDSPKPGIKYWDQSDGEPNIKSFRARRAGKDITLVSVQVGVWDGCEAFQGDLLAIYEVSGGKLIKRNTPGKLAAFVVGAVDSDGDGNSELLILPNSRDTNDEKGRLLLDDKGLWDKVEMVERVFASCPC